MRQWKRDAALVAMVTAMSLAGCASQQGPVKVYEGAVRSPAETVQVTAPEQIEIMSIDGREPPPSFLKSHVTLALLPGEHVFSLRYVELFQINSDDHEILRSKQAALRFTAAAGSSYRLEIPRQANLDAARKFSKDPQFKLVNVKDGSATDSAPIKSYAEASLIDTISKAFEGGGEARTPVTNTDLLKDVWGRATPDERKAFRDWLDTQGK
jgi:uncharacterized protein YccT (UPF0319 family)